MPNEDKSLDNLLGWATKQPASSPEERAEAEAVQKAMEGKCLETVTMRDDRSLLIVSTQYFVGGGSGFGSSESAPGDPDYEELLRTHGALKPGQSHTLTRKQVDGEWVIVDNDENISSDHT